MAVDLFLVWVVLLLILPPIVWWRWGLVTSLIVTVLELPLAGLVFYLMAIYHLFPDFSPEQPFQNPEIKSAHDQSVSGLLFYLFLFLPVAAALCGGVLAVALAGLRGIWNAVMGKRPSVDRPADSA
jgi:hypothetical protein